MNFLKLNLIILRNFLNEFSSIIKFSLRGGRFKKSNSQMINSYTFSMLDKIYFDITKFEKTNRAMQIDYALELTKLHCNQDKLDIIDFGGGIGIQAEYIAKNNNKCRVFVYEQPTLVDKILSDNKDFNEYMNNKKIYFRKSNDVIEEGHLTIFMGSLSYIQNAFDLLLDVKRNTHIIYISRLPISNDIGKKIQLKDQSGNHNEMIFSKKELENFLNNNFDVHRIYYELEPSLTKRFPLKNMRVESASYILKV